MIDLDAYLRRIGYAGARAPTLATLRAICAAQPAAIAFENIDPLLGRPPSLAPVALQAKLIGQRRGGYCYELNALLRDALLALGMNVTALAARVVFGSAADAPLRPRSHMLLKVELPAEPVVSYLADAGFGGHLLRAPLLLHGSAGPERVVASDDDSYAVEAEIDGRMTPLYRCTLDAQLPVDCEPLNWYTATHPGSIFRHNLLLERLTPAGRATLLNDRLTLREADGPARTRRIASAADFADVLERVFDLEPPIVASALFEHVPKGLDGLLLPPR